MNGPKPTDADFTKTLAVVLLAEYLAVAVVRAASLYLADAPRTIADTAHIASLWLFVAILCINVCTMAGAYGMRKDATFSDFAATSLKMTAGQVALLLASYTNGHASFHAAAAALTSIALLLTIFRGQGKFLTPTPR